MESRLIARNRRAERSKAGRQNFNALEIGPRHFERALEVVLYLVNCCVRTHNGP
jgi:hypothetical protein